MLSALRVKFTPSHGRRFYADMAAVQQKLYQELRPMEDTFKKLNLDAVVSAEEVDSLLKANQINTQTAEYLKHTITRRKEAKKAGNYWRNLFLFIGVPSIALVAVNTYYLEKEHEKHLEEHAPEQIPYEHMRIRTKKFFWGDGDSALFQHPKFKQ